MLDLEIIRNVLTLSCLFHLQPPSPPPLPPLSLLHHPHWTHSPQTPIVPSWSLAASPETHPGNSENVFNSIYVTITCVFLTRQLLGVE